MNIDWIKRAKVLTSLFYEEAGLFSEIWSVIFVFKNIEEGHRKIKTNLTFVSLLHVAIISLIESLKHKFGMCTDLVLFCTQNVMVNINCIFMF